MAALCLFAIPNFDSIAAYQVANESGALIERDGSTQRDEPLLLYLPHAGGTPSVIIGAGEPRPLTNHTDARLTRYLQLLSLRIETESAGQSTTSIILTQPPEHQIAALGPVYFGPEAALRPVLESQLWWGRVMQSAIPAAAWFAIIMALLLVFFSRKPTKYMFLVAAFSLQLIIELEVSPAWLGFRLNDYDRFIGVFTQLFIWLAIARWTESKGTGRWMILSSCVIILLSYALAAVMGSDLPPAFAKFGLALQVGWLVLFQIINWRMVLTAPMASDIVRSGTLACFLLSISGVLSYRALMTGGYSTSATFFLSNWVNVASCLSVAVFVVGALLYEVQDYRTQRRAVRDLTLLAAGHHADLSAQQLALRDEIERNAVLEERQRFMRELHDGIGNQLLGLMIKMRSSGPAAAPLTDDVEAAIAELRLVTTTLDEPDGNLAQALSALAVRLESQAASAGVALTWDVQLADGWTLPPKFILDILRIVQESVSNALKHSGASAISMHALSTNELMLIIEDNGRGFDPTSARAGLGLRNIRARAAAWGGTAEFAPREDGGTRVTIAVPRSTAV